MYECSQCQTLHFVISTSAALSYDLDPTHKRNLTLHIIEATERSRQYLPMCKIKCHIRPDTSVIVFMA